MPRYRLDLDAPPAWASLERLAELCSAHPALPPLTPDAFMYMGRLVAAGRPAVYMYKHVDSRRYLNLDAGGHAFRTAAWDDPDGAATAECLPEASIVAAISWVLAPLRGDPAEPASP
jgi:hypothetical protein